MRSEKPIILIVDDSPQNLQVVAAALAENGYEPVAAIGGAQALDFLQEHTPELILLDVMMPGIDGFEVCQRLKSNEKTKDIPIIFVTANTDDDILVKTFQVGGNDYVRKPVKRMVLIPRIKALLAQKELAETKRSKEKLTGALEMAGAVCHELNQPLTAILLSAEILRNQLPEDHQDHELVKTIFDQARIMGTITKKIKRITNYTTKKYLGKTKIIDIDKSIE